MPSSSARSGSGVDTWRLPTSKTKRVELAVAYGRDALALLTAVSHPDAPAWLRALPAVEVLRTLLQSYSVTTNRQGREVVKRREAEVEGLPPGRLRLTSPYDTDARWAAKGEDLVWNGFKVHLTKTCDAGDRADGDGGSGDGGRAGEGRVDGPPNLITDVATMDATVPDAKMTTAIHARLAARACCPASTTSIRATSAALVVDALCSYGIALVSPLGPTSPRRPKRAAATTGPALSSTSTPRRPAARRARPAPGGTRRPSAAPR
jgi:hypothetical protein